jgi:hypothetical protein
MGVFSENLVILQHELSSFTLRASSDAASNRWDLFTKDLGLCVHHDTDFVATCPISRLDNL